MNKIIQGKGMKRLIIDTDCGIDDAIAIMMALSRKDYEILGITTVSGNVDVDKVTRNVLRLLSYLGRKEIPVFKGATKPLVQDLITGELFHGETGLGKVRLPETGKKEESLKAPSAIYEVSKKNSSIHLVTLGPLTNLAIALNLYPDLKDFIEKVTIMGGAIEFGNITRFAEYNLYADPEAAEFVFKSGLKITLLTWDAVAKAFFFEEEVKGLIDSIPKEKPVSKLFLGLIDSGVELLKALGVSGIDFPDPIAMACEIDQRVIKRKQIGNIKMELNYNLMRGASVLVEGTNMEIVREIDKEVFTDHLLSMFR
ncbi:MAG: nucleoside hydrolase [Candidatus Bathyarchaeia archaeon]